MPWIPRQFDADEVPPRSPRSGCIPVIVCDKAPQSGAFSILPVVGETCVWCGKPNAEHEQTAWALGSRDDKGQ